MRDPQDPDIGPEIADTDPSATTAKTEIEAGAAPPTTLSSPAKRRPLLLHGMLLLALAAAMTYGAWMALGLYATSPGPSAVETGLVIAPGTRGAALAGQLAQAGVIRHPWMFRLLGFSTGLARRLQAGEYAFPPQTTPMSVLTMLAHGLVVVRQVTIPEGWTSAQISSALAAAEALEGAAPADLAEGSVLPDTYRYQRGETRAALLARMQKAMRDFLNLAWSNRAANSAVTSAKDALILASIVEKETGLPAERPLVAGVFSNRLRQGMKLQADPTVSYGLTLGREKLAHGLDLNDLARDTPYNSYTRTGLPPTPICHPGRAAIEAAVTPPANDLLYFVADGGSGGHRFAATLAEHNRNVADYHRRLGR